MRITKTDYMYSRLFSIRNVNNYSVIVSESASALSNLVSVFCTLRTISLSSLASSMAFSSLCSVRNSMKASLYAKNAFIISIFLETTIIIVTFASPSILYVCIFHSHRLYKIYNTYDTNRK